MKSYPKPKPMTPEDVDWFKRMIRLQTNVQSVDKPIKQGAKK
jgi:hypothetical protein